MKLQSQPKQIEIPRKWEKCTITGMFPGLAAFRAHAMDEVIRKAIKTRTHDEVEAFIERALQDDAPPEVDAIAQKAVQISGDETARHLNTFNSITESIAVTFLMRVEKEYQTGHLIVHRIAETKEAAFVNWLRSVIKKKPAIEVSFS